MTAHFPGFNKKWQGQTSLIGPNLEINIAFYHFMKDVILDMHFVRK